MSGCFIHLEASTMVAKRHRLAFSFIACVQNRRAGYFRDGPGSLGIFRPSCWGLGDDKFIIIIIIIIILTVTMF